MWGTGSFGRQDGVRELCRTSSPLPRRFGEAEEDDATAASEGEGQRLAWL